MISAASTARATMSRVAAVFNVSRKNRAMRPGRLGAALFNDDVGSKGARSSGSAIGERPSTAAPGVLTGAGMVPRSAVRSTASGPGPTPWGLVRSRTMGPGDCKGCLLLEQYDQQREDQDAEAQLRDRRVAEGTIEADEAEEGTQQCEDRDGGACIGHERRDQHPANRQFVEAVHHDVVDRGGSRSTAPASTRN